jgi:F-type H+-transporting ATPase subunit gamma
MPAPKEIRSKITSIKKTQKITDAMQKVAASKMRRAEMRMQTSMPYATKVLEVMQNISRSHSEYVHPYCIPREKIKRVGLIVVATDRGLCGGLNINLFRLALETAQKWHNQNINVDWCLFGEKATLFFKYLKANVIAQTSHLGEAPQVSDLIGGIKIMLDAFSTGTIDNLFIAHNKFVTTIQQKPQIVQLLPITNTKRNQDHLWDYIYEPDPVPLLNTLAVRYIETQVYQAVVDNIACEQVARMVAMQSATDNAEELLAELQLVYNKARQAAITQEIAEIIGGADAVV